jgi:cytochrome c oxidase subunit 3
MAEIKILVAEQFDDPVQQKEAATLGMWTFLATEVLFFGVLFMSYIVLRSLYPLGFSEGSHECNRFYGTINTAILLTSSLTMALAVHAAQLGKLKSLMGMLALTILLALGFLVVKGLEYHEDFTKHLVPGNSFSAALSQKAELFFILYWAMTGLHAIHVFAGIVMLSILFFMARQNKFSERYYNPVEIGGLYWHFVDIVWIFLYPLLYLIT